MLQDSSGAIVEGIFKTLKWMLGIIFLLFRYVIIPITAHGFEHGWLFTALGIVGAIVACSYAYSGAISWGLAIVIGIASVAAGVAGTVFKVRWNRQNLSNMYTTPDAPDELTE